MADWSKPTITSGYADFVAEMNAKFSDLALGNDPNRGVSITNPETYTARWNSATLKWEYFNGTAWVDLATNNTYGINISGTAAKWTTGRTITLTGDATGISAAFDGSGNLSFATTLANSGVTAATYGSATQAPVIVVDAKGRITSASNSTVTPAWASITSKPTTLSGYGITDSILNGGGTPSITQGVAASRPAAGTGGRVYVSTDTGSIGRDTGSAWEEMSPAFTGDVTKVAKGTTLTLATVNANVGTFGAAGTVPSITVNAKGLITAVSGIAISIPGTAVTSAVANATNANAAPWSGITGKPTTCAGYGITGLDVATVISSNAGVAGKVLTSTGPDTLPTWSDAPGMAYIYDQYFSGNGSQTAFTLLPAPTVSVQLQVFISGVRQGRVVDYSFNNGILTFTSPPPTGTNNIYCTWGAPMAEIGPFSTSMLVDGAITTGKFDSAALCPSAVLVKKQPVSTTTTTATVDDVGKCIDIAAGITIPASTFSAGDDFSINNSTAGPLTITQGSGLTLRQAGTATTGNYTIPAYGKIGIWFRSATEAVIYGIGGGSGSILVFKMITDTNDVSLPDIASSYVALGSSFTVDIPSDGDIELSTTGRLMNDGGTYNGFSYIGIRVDGVNYWGGEYYTSSNGLTNKTIDHQTNSTTAGTYVDYYGQGTNYQNAGQGLFIHIAARGLPTGINKTVQIIAARMAGMAAACSYRGTQRPTRIKFKITTAS